MRSDRAVVREFVVHALDQLNSTVKQLHGRPDDGGRIESRTARIVRQLNFEKGLRRSDCDFAFVEVLIEESIVQGVR